MSLTLQAGAGAIEGSVDLKLGIIALRVKALALDLVTAITGAPPDGIGISIPESLPRNFTLRADGQAYDVILNFEGHLDPAAADGEEFSLDGTTSEEELETHPDLLSLVEWYGGEIDAASGKVKFPEHLPAPEGPDGASGPVKNPLFGVEKYLVPGEVWNRKYVSEQLPANLVRGLGTIDTPPGNPPEIEGRRNWLKIRARAALRGNIWQIEESWLLSGPDGWNEDVYRYT